MKSKAFSYVKRFLNTNLIWIISYVLGTLFCTEARAYNRNQQLYNEGLQTDYFAKGTSMAQFIDDNYIGKFGVTYGSTANSMSSWCLNQGSMSHI